MTIAAVAALVGGTAAYAQSSPAQSVYNNGEVLGTVQGGGPADIVPPGTANGNSNAPTPAVARENGASTPVAAPSGSLPFTGFEAGLVALAGLALLGTGIAMRRVARSNEA